MYLIRSKPEPNLKCGEKMKVFFVAHWRGIIILMAPIVFCFILLPKGGAKYAESFCYCGYTLILMGIFWMTECLPLAITAIIPFLIFPLTGVMGTPAVAKCYINDTVIMFLGSLMLAYSVEQSGLHKRLAYKTINCVGFSHRKLLLGICIVTTFVSMWITNTAATTMMVPIIFAILRVFDSQGIVKMYEKNEAGEKYASDMTVCYFCCATYSATVGGIGTLIGTGTNLVFKGLFESSYSKAGELLSFPKFSAFGVPYMILLEIFVYLSLSCQYLGTFRPKSAVAKKAEISLVAQTATKKAIAEELKKIGKITYHEIMVLLLFGGAIIAFFCRSPQIFTGWADKLDEIYKRPSPLPIKDSTLCTFVLFLMFLLPASLTCCKSCSAKCHEQLPKGPTTSILNWSTLNDRMPYSYMFLLGGGFAISTAASSTKLNDKISESMSFMTKLSAPLAILIIVISVILITNFASNVAVANVFVPIFMSTAEKMKMNPLWACIATGFSASHCFLLPVGTPGNLIVQGAAKIRTMSMVKCGIGPTITTILVTWLLVTFYAPVIWPVLKKENFE